MWTVPKSCAEDRVLLAAHGGGYVAGSMYTHRKVYAHVATAIGCGALIVDYRRLPENVHPGPVNDIARSYKWLLDQGIRPKHVAIIGDSAGGGPPVTPLLHARAPECAPRSGYAAEPFCYNGRLGGGRPRSDHASTPPRARPAAAGRHHAALAMA